MNSNAKNTMEAPFINTWLLLGTFDNSQNKGFVEDLIGESRARPQAGEFIGDRKWQYFDDRLFSRNYDDYLDLYSYYTIKQNSSSDAKLVYAHVYVYSPAATEAELRTGADRMHKVWLNGKHICTTVTPESCSRDDSKTEIHLSAGWNSLLLKVANDTDGFFGFYARICDGDGNALPKLVYSTGGDSGKLAVSTTNLADISEQNMPTGYRDWPYVSFTVPYVKEMEERWPETLEFAPFWPKASDFVLTAEGGKPPYKWSITGGKLPDGLSLIPNGRIVGKVAYDARIDEWPFVAQVTDADGEIAEKRLSIIVNERPNKWYEEGRLSALIHAPEVLPGMDFDGLGKLMKRQGYCIGLPIAYNNGEYIFRWPSPFDPDTECGDNVSQTKAGLEQNGVKFGMYVGNLVGAPQFRYRQSVAMLKEGIDRYKPSAFWFDWATVNHPSTDAIYSLIKSANPETVIVLNGLIRPGNGDWDILCLENFSYGDYSMIWGEWPGENMRNDFPMVYEWPKANAMESWRLMMNPISSPGGVESKDPLVRNVEAPDWQDMLRLQISLIGDGHIANMDHSATVGTRNGFLQSLSESVIIQAHEQMADWANPEGLTPLYTSYTMVNPGPLPIADWGYNLTSSDGMTVYLHFIENPRGKTGLSPDEQISVGPLAHKVSGVTWMNTGKSLHFEQTEDALCISLAGVSADPVDTIMAIHLADPVLLSECRPASFGKTVFTAPKPGNLAAMKPAKLLSLDESHEIPPACNSGYASKGVDSMPNTFAAGGEWAWTYHIDLEQIYPIREIRLTFARGGYPTIFAEEGYPTEYKVNISTDGFSWQTVAQDSEAIGEPVVVEMPPTDVRYIRVLGIKPNTPKQRGGQMCIAEVEAYR